MTSSKPRRQDGRNKRATQSHKDSYKRSNLPVLNPTADFVLSLLLLSITPLVLVTKYIYDKFCGRNVGNSKNNLSLIDPRGDGRILNLDDNSHVITCISGGCHVFEYLLHGSNVTAVDEDIHQFALMELKVTSMLNLPFDQFFEIFGNSNIKLLRSVYKYSLRDNLSNETVLYWDKELPNFTSFIYDQRNWSGYLSWRVFQFLLYFIGLGFIKHDLENNVHSEVFRKKVQGYKFRLQTLAYLVDSLLYRFGLCFPSVFGQQASLGMHRSNNVSAIVDRALFQSDLVEGNYIFAGYILGRYTKQNAPNYLKAENFRTLKASLKEKKLTLVNDSLASAIVEFQSTFSAASLLDIFDNMKSEDINSLLTSLTPKMDPESGRILWRSVSKYVHASPLALLKPKIVLEKKERSGLHWSTWVADMSSCPVYFEERNYDTVCDQGYLRRALTGLQIISFSLWQPITSSLCDKSGHSELMDSFYKYQNESYDDFREGMLHARPILATAMPLRKSKGMVWVDVGGGTARILEYFEADVIREYFQAIYVVDVSSSLLKIARRRVKAMGLGDIVHIIERDISEENILSSFGVSPHSVDVVTFSYSLSMMQCKAVAMDNASKLVKRNGEGILAIADFFESNRSDKLLPRLYSTFRQWEIIIHRRWFAIDNVYLVSDAHLHANLSHMNRIWNERFRGAVPFVPFLMPYHGVVIYQHKS